MRARSTPPVLLVAITVCAWLVGLAALAARPAASLDEASGLYGVQGAEQPHRWTSNRVRIPIHAGSGPTVVALTLGESRWPGRPAPTVTLASDQGALATFAAPEGLRRYHALLPASASLLTLDATVGQPPQGDPRWLGVTVYGLAATRGGVPLRAAAEALVPALVALLFVFAAAWCVRRGYGIELALAVLALALRVALLTVAPPGFRPDEVVSLVDAWHLSQTAHDHLGHLLPLGAQEAFGDWISPLLTYLELPAVALLGPRVLAGRLVTAIYGALAAPLLYWLARALALPVPAAICAGLAAACSPWQIFMSRIALPPALVPTSWTLCLLAGLLLIRRGGRPDALLLGLAGGVALYAYPTLKLAVPLLLALAGALALLRHGWRALPRWLPGAALAGLLWLPFVYVTLFNPASSTRLDQTTIQADTWGAWLVAWWRGYSVYFQPAFYYAAGDGSSIRGVPGHGVELVATAPLVALGLVTLIYRAIADRRRQLTGLETREAQSAIEWWFLTGAVAIAPLAASLTQPSPHTYRAATIAPLYALLAGLGAATVWRLLGKIPRAPLRRAIQAGASVALIAALAWQAGAWLRDYTQVYPAQVATANQDGLIEAMERAIGHAADFDEVWISYQNINEPYIYLLAAQPMPPAQAQRQLAVTRRAGHFNDITAIGGYHFADLAAIPRRLPVLEAIPDQFGGPAFVLQEWRQDGKRILLLRRME